mmetsp:Transcript_52996/g.113722  ORF Transcript_52996/g.113722 Transcript_52996/m.113722 type:complete len:564 (+) Transcript_52996:148-1839(+)
MKPFVRSLVTRSLVVLGICLLVAPNGAVLHGSALRGSGAHASHARDIHSNPWRRSPTFHLVEGNIQPVAPEDRLSPGIEAQDDTAPDFTGWVAYFPPHDDQPGPFPMSDPDADVGATAPPRSNFLTCFTSPHDWTDSHGNSCTSYEENDWCTQDGYEGNGWERAWGPLGDYAGRYGVTASEACCKCGGGIPSLVTGTGAGQLSERRLVAARDRLPAPTGRWSDPTGPPLLAAPGDFLPLRDSPVAPRDAIPVEFARHLHEVHAMQSTPEPMGLSARFFVAAPSRGCYGPKPVASAVDRSLDYGMLGEGGAAKLLRWPGRVAPPRGSVYWGRWTGTLQIFRAGSYVFDLDIGFNTQSSFQVDGRQLLTQGQCRASPDGKTCFAKGCVWTAETATCAAPRPPPASLGASSGEAASAAHVEAVVVAPAMAPPPLEVVMPSLPATPSFQVPMPAPAPALAPAPAPMPMEVVAMAPAPMAMLSMAQEQTAAGQVELEAGGHCIDALVMALPTGRTLRLRYRGPDTGGVETVIPGQVLFCDPVIEACRTPEMQACTIYEPSCQGASIGS